MKKVTLLISLFLIAIFTTVAQEQTPATEAGEDFDLNAVMSIMENAEDLADLEKKINDSDNQINNLDLNKDDEIDIIKIVEYDENQTRVLVLRAVLGDNDFQDVATIEIEKHSEEEISLQVIGDPDLYGADYILEPAPAEPGDEEQGGGDFQVLHEVPDFLSAAVFVSVHRWRPIRPLFVVGRVAFVSAVAWRPMPVWFMVRRPIARSTWRGRSRRYRNNRYRSSRSRHSRHGRNMYSNKRKKSPTAKKNVGPKPATKSSPAKTTSTQSKKTSTSSNKTNSAIKKSNTPSSKYKSKPTTSSPKKTTSSKKSGPGAKPPRKH